MFFRISKTFTTTLLVLIAVLGTSCNEFKERKDIQIPGKIVNTWYSKNTKVVLVKIDVALEGPPNRHIQEYCEFTDEYFGSLNPQNGDCVSIWVSLYKRTEIVRRNRNLLPGPTSC